jgi:hypothetical protein
MGMGLSSWGLVTFPRSPISCHPALDAESMSTPGAKYTKRRTVDAWMPHQVRDDR